jgi:hypothetical protein
MQSDSEDDLFPQHFGVNDGAVTPPTPVRAPAASPFNSPASRHNNIYAPLPSTSFVNALMRPEMRPRQPFSSHSGRTPQLPLPTAAEVLTAAPLPTAAPQEVMQTQPQVPRLQQNIVQNANGSAFERQSPTQELQEMVNEFAKTLQEDGTNINQLRRMRFLVKCAMIIRTDISSPGIFQEIDDIFKDNSELNGQPDTATEHYLRLLRKHVVTVKRLKTHHNGSQ